MVEKTIKVIFMCQVFVAFADRKLSALIELK
jgi:hypothetical protein